MIVSLQISKCWCRLYILALWWFTYPGISFTLHSIEFTFYLMSHSRRWFGRRWFRTREILVTFQVWWLLYKRDFIWGRSARRSSSMKQVFKNVIVIFSNIKQYTFFTWAKFTDSSACPEQPRRKMLESGPNFATTFTASWLLVQGQYHVYLERLVLKHWLGYIMPPWEFLAVMQILVICYVFSPLFLVLPCRASPGPGRMPRWGLHFSILAEAQYFLSI